MAREIRRTMTLSLMDSEMRVLGELSEKKDLTKTAVVRQALRLYLLFNARLSRGERLFFEDKHKKKKAELIVVI
jgi:hypothetical protein